MNKLFLGKPLHWLLLLVVIALGWWAGLDKLHVTQFNRFVIGTLVVACVVVFVVFRTVRADEQVTRDPPPTDEDLA